MSIYDISKVSRNKYITDDIKACEQEIKLSHNDFLSIENSIMSLANESNINEWEKWFELSHEPTWALKDRVDRLIYTFNSRGFFTPEFLKEQAMVFTNGEIDIIEDFSNYHFIIKFVNTIGTPPNLENFKEMIKINKPVHLTFDIEFRSRTWGDLKPYAWEILNKYTWEQIKSTTEIKGV